MTAAGTDTLAVMRRAFEDVFGVPMPDPDADGVVLSFTRRRGSHTVVVSVRVVPAAPDGAVAGVGSVIS